MSELIRFHEPLIKGQAEASCPDHETMSDEKMGDVITSTGEVVAWVYYCNGGHIFKVDIT